MDPATGTKQLMFLGLGALAAGIILLIVNRQTSAQDLDISDGECENEAVCGCQE